MLSAKINNDWLTLFITLLFEKQFLVFSRPQTRILHDPIGEHGGVGVNARFDPVAAGVAPGGDADEGAVVDEGGAVVALAQFHKNSSANFAWQDAFTVDELAFGAVDDGHVGTQEEFRLGTAQPHASPAGHLSGRGVHHRGVLRQQFDGGGVHPVQLYGLTRMQLEN
jgi:hypothetical protein